MIVYGWNHFKLKSIDPHSVGLSQYLSGMQIEVRQRYFHLFWIPCFSLGKKWALRKGNQLFELPVQYQQLLKSRQDIKVKTPFYTYALPLMALFVGTVYYINEQISDYRSEQHSKQEFAMQYEDNAARFRKPSLDDYYILTSEKGYTTRYARITGLDKNNIQLSYITKPVYAYKPSEIAKLFVDPANQLETVTVSRGDSAKLICGEYDNRYKFKGIDLKGEEYKFRVEKVVRLDGPIITGGGYASYRANAINLELANEGLAGNLTKVEPVEGNVKWTCSETLPMSLPSDGEVTLYGAGDYKTPYKVKLSLVGDDGRTVQYLLEGHDYEKHITRLN
ncbi:MAG: hypothetical protein J7621_26145 [Niastella sp.]|nr:hypothetical protein [Niastella sp.]